MSLMFKRKRDRKITCVSDNANTKSDCFGLDLRNGPFCNATTGRGYNLNVRTCSWTPPRISADRKKFTKATRTAISTASTSLPKTRFSVWEFSFGLLSLMTWGILSWGAALFMLEILCGGMLRACNAWNRIEIENRNLKMIIEYIYNGTRVQWWIQNYFKG